MNLSTRTSLALAAFCSAAAIAPAVASASKVVTYDVEAYGNVEWSHQLHTASQDSSLSSGGWFSWNTQVDLGHVTFRDGYLEHDVYGAGQQLAAGKVDAEATHKGSPTRSGACKLDNQVKPGPAAHFGKPGWAEQKDEWAAIAISESDVQLDWDCEGDLQPTLPATFGTEPLEHDDTFGNRPLDAPFQIPKEVVGFGKIIQNVDGPGVSTLGYCPEKWYDGVEKCTFGWTGTVTLTKVGEQNVADPAPSGSADAGGATSGLGADWDPELAPLVLPNATASTDARASKVSFTAQCQGGCSGDAALSVAGAKAGVSAAKPVARMRFKVKSGKARTVTLKLPAKARRALRRSRRGTLRVTLKKPGRVAVTRTLRVKVPRR